MTALESNKAKTARRVVEVFEFFDEQNRQATVMDIARRYNRPQSSTSELLAIMVEMGLLYKDRRSRTFRPTPRAAMLGSAFQPNVVRDGRLAMLTRKLSAETGLGVAVVGMVGLRAQIFCCTQGDAHDLGDHGHLLSGGACVDLHESAAGWLLLSTLSAERVDAMLRRLRAESPEERIFSPADVRERVRDCGHKGFAAGASGFRSDLAMSAVLLPSEAGDCSLALSLVHPASDAIGSASLVALLQRSVQSCFEGPATQVVALEAYRTRWEDAARRRTPELEAPPSRHRIAG